MNCSFTLSTEPETFFVVAVSRFTKALASD